MLDSELWLPCNLSEALQKDGILSGSGAFSLDDIAAPTAWADLGSTQTTAQALPESPSPATEVGPVLPAVTQTLIATCLQAMICPTR